MARTKGSVSFSEITLAELNEKFKPDAVILVSLKFLKANGMSRVGVYANSVPSVPSVLAPQEETHVVSIQEVTA